MPWVLILSAGQKSSATSERETMTSGNKKGELPTSGSSQKKTDLPRDLRNRKEPRCHLGWSTASEPREGPRRYTPGPSRPATNPPGRRPPRRLLSWLRSRRHSTARDSGTCVGISSVLSHCSLVLHIHLGDGMPMLFLPLGLAMEATPKSQV